MQNHVIQVEERPPLPMFLPLCLQHLFAMFGATILVPFLFKVDPTTCIFLLIRRSILNHRKLLGVDLAE